MAHPYFIAGNVWNNNPIPEEDALSESWIGNACGIDNEQSGKRLRHKRRKTDSMRVCFPRERRGSTYSYNMRKGAYMTSSWRLVFIALVGFLGCSSLILTDSLRAQDIEGLEAADNRQPAPTNMSPEEARKHHLNCPGGPSTQFRLGGKVKNPRTFNLDTLRGHRLRPLCGLFIAQEAAPPGSRPVNGQASCSMTCSSRLSSC